MFSAAGAAVFLLIAFAVAVPLFLRWPYGQCRVETDNSVLTPVQFLGIALTRPQTFGVTDSQNEPIFTTRWVAIGPARRVAFILALKRSGRSPVWLVWSPSKRYPERGLRLFAIDQPA